MLQVCAANNFYKHCANGINLDICKHFSCRLIKALQSYTPSNIHVAIIVSVHILSDLFDLALTFLH